MISTKITNLADDILDGAVRGKELSVERAANIGLRLLDLADQVREWEARLVPANARAPQLIDRDPALPQPSGIAR